MEAKKYIEFLNLLLILFEKTQLFTKKSFLACFCSVKPWHSKTSSRLTVFLALVFVENFPHFLYDKAEVFYLLNH